MLTILNITAPIFIVLGIGYLTIRYRYIDKAYVRGIGVLVMRIILPALIFNAVATKPINEILLPNYLIGYGLGSLLTFIIGVCVLYFIRKQNLTLAALNGLGVSFSNTGYIGYPLLAILISTPAAIYLAMNMLIENILILPLFLVLAESSTRDNVSIGKTLTTAFLNMLKNPLIIGLAAGLFVSISGIKVPAMLMKVAEMFAFAAAPVGLFVCGASLYGLKLRGDMLDISLITIGKLLIHPLVVLAVFMLIPNVERDMLFYAVLLAAAPMGSLFPLLGQRYGYEDRSAAVLLVATSLSFFTISLLLALYTSL